MINVVFFENEFDNILEYFAIITLEADINKNHYLVEAVWPYCSAIINFKEIFWWILKLFWAIKIFKKQIFLKIMNKKYIPWKLLSLFVNYCHHCLTTRYDYAYNTYSHLTNFIVWNLSHSFFSLFSLFPIPLTYYSYQYETIVECWL